MGYFTIWTRRVRTEMSLFEQTLGQQFQLFIKKQQPATET